MTDRRKSPTPMHSTGAFPVWVKDARDVANHLEGAGQDEETCGLVLELRQWADMFQGWTEDPTARPKPEDRLPYRSKFLTVYRRAMTRVVELAKARPDGGGWRKP